MNMALATSCTQEELKIKDLVDAHWSYIEEFLRAHEEPEVMIKIVEFHYKSAFAHGWKHAKEDLSN